MKVFFEKVLKHKVLILSIFVIATILSTLLQGQVQVNYNLADYLPEDTPSTTALLTMNEEFSQSTPNMRIYLPNTSIPDALKTKEKLLSLDCVESVTWLDDIMNIYEPLETADPATVSSYYKDGGALFSVTVAETGNHIQALQTIRDAMGEGAAISGTIANSAAAQQSTKTEITQIMVAVVPMVLVILLLTTHSWFEPLLFLITIGVSIMMNMGSNIFFGKVSFITQAVAPILQLAISMDYAIFLLNSFAEFRKQGMEIRQAMHSAMVKSFSTVLASALTTVFGFLALVIMRFKIGPDLGIVLAKGIFFSLVSVMFFLPVLAVLTYKCIDKTQHRSFIPSFDKFGRFVGKVRVPVLIVICLILVPCFMAQQQNTFKYGASEAGSGGRVGEDTILIDNTFGKSCQMALMVPRDQWAKETALNNDLQQIPAVTSVISYVNTVGAEIPVEYLPEEITSQMLSEHYSRFVINLDSEDEGDEAFALVEQVRNLVHEYYGDDYLLCGTSVNNYDMRQSITSDNTLVNGAAILAIGLVLLFTFKSLSLPLILLLTIEASIWINLSFPYFMGTSIHYIGYLVISTVQLGATVDYAILYTQHYISNRSLLSRKKAAAQSLSETAASILTPACILTIAGIMIGVLSSNSVVSQLGTVLGRGAAISAFMVLFFLPTLLTLLDKVIQKTTYHLHFYVPAKDVKKKI